MRFRAIKSLYPINYKGFAGRTLIVFVIVSILYGGYYVLVKFSAVNDVPNPSRASLSVKLNEHLLAINNLRDIDTDDPSTPHKIESVRSSIDATLNAYKEEVSRYYQSNQSPSNLNFERFLSQEQLVLKAYDENYQTLGKASQYTLEQDIGFIDPKTDQQEISTRAKITIDNLENIKKSNVISNQTSSKLNQAISCIQSIDSNPPDNASLLRQNIAKCDKIYSQVKPLILKDLLRPLHSNSAKTLGEDIKQLIDQI